MEVVDIYYCSAVKSFVELVRYVFMIPGVKVFLSEKLCQDPLEKFFGCQPQREGGGNENPNAQDFYKNTQALRVINSFCVDSVKGNCRENKTPALYKENMYCSPVHKGKCRHQSGPSAKVMFNVNTV